MGKRVFLIVLDSVGIGEMPDAHEYNDEGSNTLKAASTSNHFSMPNMRCLGLFNIDGVDIGERVERPEASFARMTEKSKGKDTTIGHWEISGVISPKPLPTYTEGFTKEVLEEFKKLQPALFRNCSNRGFRRRAYEDRESHRLYLGRFGLPDSGA
jgi:phosphopentomutase